MKYQLMLPSSDLQKLQQTINGITAAQSELSPEELLVFQALITLFNSGNFEASESGNYIQLIKNALQQHSKNRLLQVHLKNFIVLCEKYFKTQTATPIGVPSTINNRTQQTNTAGKAKSSSNSSMQAIIVIGIVLGTGYFMVKDSDWFNKLFSGSQEATKQVEAMGNFDYMDRNFTISERQPVGQATEIEKTQPDVQSSAPQTQQTPPTLPGKFPQASERLLTASDLQDLSKEDLRIMRNEIFARHGYIFQTNEMKSYFQNQSWYSPRHSNVNSLLTNIEQRNITLIQRYE